MRFLLAIIAAAASAAGAPLFEASEPLDVELVGPIRELIRKAGDAPRASPFELRHAGRSLPVAVRVRSQSRRIFCAFPPLRWRFAADAAADTPFAGQDRLKLVTHCRGSRGYEVNALEEYVAYRILNLVTEVSFRVRLLRIRYVDGNRADTRWGFLIEDVDALARRLGGSHVEPAYVAPGALEPRHATLVAVFQYLIANTDFSMTAPREGRACCHNAKLVQAPAALFSVPYDFDFSGLVNAPYAGANPVVKARSVRQRIYRGYCADTPTLAAAVAAFQARRGAIDALFETTPGLTPKDARRAVAFVDGFFAALDRNGLETFARCR